MARILILANFCDGRILRGRFTYLANLLVSRGHQVEIITSDFEHSKKTYKAKFENRFEFTITHIHEPAYPDNISIKRLWSHYVWGRNVYKYLKESEHKWDVIYCAVPSLTVTRLVGKYANKHNIRFFTDVQDLWPEAFAIVIKNQMLSKFLFAPLTYYANLGYKRADAVIGVSDTYRDRGMKPTKPGCIGLTVYLGNDGQVFDEAKEKYKIIRPENEIWVAYIGTLGYSYDIKCVIEAINIIKRNAFMPKIKFIIMGNGPLKSEFEKYAFQMGVDSLFTGSLPYQEMVGLMCSCDIVVNPIVRFAAASITNKVGDYALSGLPVVNTQQCDEYRRLLEQYDCGINCETSNSDQVADAIVKLIKDKKLRTIMGQNSRKLGLERFDRRYSYLKIVDLIESLVK